MKSADNLTAEVTGDIDAVDGVLKITAIRILYRFTIPAGLSDKAKRALTVYADGCPAYQTVKDVVACSWEADITEEPATE